MAPQIFKEEYEAGLDVRPTIAATKAHMTMAEMEMLVKKGSLKVDGKIVVNERGDLAVSKAAVEPVWYLPGVAKRFGIDEGLLRRALFEDTGGMYPELITRPDLKVYLPPIGGISVYIFGNPAYISGNQLVISKFPCAIFYQTLLMLYRSRPDQEIDPACARRVQWLRRLW